MKYRVLSEFKSRGVLAATASQDGSKIAIDFANLYEPTEALRLGIPVENLQTLIAELLRIQKALEEPASIRISPPH